MKRQPLTASIVAVALAAASGRATADEASQSEPAISASWAVDGVVIAGAVAVAGLSGLISVDTSTRWNRQLLPFDDATKRNFSASAARTSDVMLTLSLATPVALQLGQGVNQASGKRTLVYLETIALGLALNGVTKRLVARPRPYVYNEDPRVVAYAMAEGTDSHLSFYSGHSATTFAAAAASGYLFAQSTEDIRARTAVWTAGLLLAGATADLRVRAGKHFPTDVLTGAVVGAGIGTLVPWLHYRGHNPRRLTAPEWIAIVAAPIVGALLGQLVPARSDITEPL
jgi:membrane-associated phospholipid phosphatase